MAYQPTGYPKGRPRRGEIRPLTKKTIARREWYYDHLDREQARNRAANLKFRIEQPERWKEINASSKLRAKLWDKKKNRKLSRGIQKLRKKHNLDDGLHTVFTVVINLE